MYAVIKTGGKQYRVKPDDVLEIERISGEPGDIVEFAQVLLVAGESGIEVGSPLVAQAIVAAELVEHTRGDKIIVFKKKRRKHYRRTLGHRQDLSQIRITEILTGGAKPSPKKAAAKKKAAPKKAAPMKAPPKAAPAGKAEQPAPTVSEAAAEPKAKAKAPATKTPATKAPATKAPATKAPATKAPAKKAPAKKAATKKAATKKAAAKKTPRAKSDKKD